MDSAQRSIHLATYTLSESKIISALNRAADRGLEVVVIMDSRQAHGVQQKLSDKIQFIKRRGKGLMHQKLVTIDGHQVWLGTANMTYSSLRAFGNLVIALECPELASQLQEQMGQEIGAPRHDYTCNGQCFEYWQLPADREALARLITLIDGAKEQIRIAMFTWTHPDLTAAVIRASQRGVSVQAVIDRSSGRGSSRHTVSKLDKAGIPISLSIGPELFHYKIAWIDEQLVIGSANWTLSAFDKNCDCFLILHALNPGQQKALGALWNVIWVESNPVT